MANRLVLALTLLCSQIVWAEQALNPQSVAFSEDRGWAENELLQALKAIHRMEPNLALEQLDSLTATFPSYRLANLIKADLLAIKAGQYSKLVQQKQQTSKQKSRQALMAEASVRWQAVQQDHQVSQTLLQQYLLKASDEPYLVIVNTQLHRLFLYRQTDSGFEEVASYYISIGREGIGKQAEGDLKTPIGIYRVVEHIDDAQLPELYGVAALTLNYPNNWDRQRGRTGSGIWLHGTPRSTFSRPPMASRGCVVLNNPQMSALVDQFQLSAQTPVLIVDKNIEEQDILWQENQQILTEVQYWLKEQAQSVDWRSVSVYRYPGENGLFWVNYRNQDRSSVEQFWQKQTGHWKLVLQKTTPIVLASSN